MFSVSLFRVFSEGLMKIVGVKQLKVKNSVVKCV